MNVCLLQSIASTCELEQTTSKIIKHILLLNTYHRCCNSGLELQRSEQVLLCQT